MNKSIIVLSGGMDSITLLYDTVKKQRDELILAVNFNYGSKHNYRERLFAEWHCKKLGIRFECIDIDFTKMGLISDLLVNGGEIPHGHYASDNMKKTVVPFRNGIMLSIAAGIAESNEAKYLYIANHAGDHTIYPDCRPEFIKHMSSAIYYGTYNLIQIESPFCAITKTEICKIGLEYGIEYDMTWSCYEGKERPCLKCGTCVERTEAFLYNNTIDPILNSEEWKTAVDIYRKYKMEEIENAR